MKKLAIILFLLVSCKKEVFTPTVPSTKDVFSISQNIVSNGDALTFTLKVPGTYTLTINDTIQNQVITREQFNGKLGVNKLNIYTKSLPGKYLYLLLEDSSKTQIGKTTLIIN
jgi:hypothetical protein